jgi:membrane protease YdiL (CAAX protease family)
MIDRTGSRAVQPPPTPLQAEASLCIELLQLLLLAALLQQLLRPHLPLPEPWWVLEHPPPPPSLPFLSLAALLQQLLRLASGAQQQAPRPTHPQPLRRRFAFELSPAALGSGLATGAVAYGAVAAALLLLGAAAGGAGEQQGHSAAAATAAAAAAAAAAALQPAGLAAKVAGSCLVTPLLEEALFRGLLLPCLCAALPPSAAVSGAWAAFSARPPAPRWGLAGAGWCPRLGRRRATYAGGAQLSALAPRQASSHHHAAKHHAAAPHRASSRLIAGGRQRGAVRRSTP